jgi:Flp pilus assembly protein TadD
LFVCLCVRSSLQGGSKAQEAAYTYEELIDKYGGSALLLSGLAVAKMHQNQFEEAETLLQEALTKVSNAS